MLETLRSFVRRFGSGVVMRQTRWGTTDRAFAEVSFEGVSLQVEIDDQQGIFEVSGPFPIAGYKLTLQPAYADSFPAAGDGGPPGVQELFNVRSPDLELASEWLGGSLPAALFEAGPWHYRAHRQIVTGSGYTHSRVELERVCRAVAGLSTRGQAIAAELSELAERLGQVPSGLGEWRADGAPFARTVSGNSVVSIDHLYRAPRWRRPLGGLHTRVRVGAANLDPDQVNARRDGELAELLTALDPSFVGATIDEVTLCMRGFVSNLKRLAEALKLARLLAGCGLAGPYR